MKNHFSILLLSYLIIFLSLTSIAQEDRPVHLGLVYPLSTNGVEAPSIRNNVSIHAIYGVSAAESGMAIYGLGGIVKGSAKGLVASGIWTDIHGTLEGAQMSGIFNRANDASRGSQFAGVLNLTKEAAAVQMAGVLNKARQVDALQASGVVNTTHGLEGVQVAGVSNIADKVKGAQFAGVVNVAQQVDGFQLAGVVNKAQKVKGVQLAGLLNIADSSDYPIALVNLIKNGEQRLGVSTDEAFNSMVTFRSGGGKLYGILGLGTKLDYKITLYGFESGFGLKLVDRQPFRLDLEAFNVFLADFHGLEYNKSGVRLLPAIGLSNRIYLYGGPSINYTVHDIDDESLIKLPLWERNPRDLHKSIHVGYSIGIQVKL